MAEVLFNNVFIVGFILFIHLEAFFFLCYNPVVHLSKVLKITKTNYTQRTLADNGTNSVYFFIFFISLFFTKTTVFGLGGVLVLTVLFLYKVNAVLEKFNNTTTSNNVVYLILPSFVTFLYLLFITKSFLVLFFLIELYGVLYYFCFLTSYNFTNQTILKYKNGLLLLLWNNFLTTFFLGLGCFFLIKNTGSSDFEQLRYLNVDSFGIYFFLLGLFWKLGIPLFHFFKLEVYKYLLKENVFLFSIITTLINILLLYICFSQPCLFSVVYSNNFLVLSALFAISLAIINLKLTNFLQFFALSGVFTLTTVLSVFLI